MLYYLFNYLQKVNFPGARVFNYVTFRAAVAIILALVMNGVKKVFEIVKSNTADVLSFVLRMGKRANQKHHRCHIKKSAFHNTVEL